MSEKNADYISAEVGKSMQRAGYQRQHTMLRHQEHSISRLYHNHMFTVRIKYKVRGGDPFSIMCNSVNAMIY